MQTRYITLVFLIFILGFGCNPKKAIIPVTEAPDRSIEDLTLALTNHNYNFSWFAGEAGIHVDSPQESIKGKAYIRIRRDSVIWSVVKKLGVEGGRILITPESYATINRINGTYTKGKTNSVLSQMGLGYDFYDVQEAIFGNLIIPDSFTFIKMTNLYVLESKVDQLNIKYIIDGHSMGIQETTISDDNNRSITVYFDNYKDVIGYTNFAYNRSYLLYDPTNGETKIDLKFKKVEIDKRKNTKFTIPPHYEKMD